MNAEYKWRQLSMWDFSEDNCVEKYVRGLNGGHLFHFVLEKLVSKEGNVSTWETPSTDTGVPADVLSWETPEYYLKTDGKSSVRNKEPS